ncbi:hypothetical protein AGMMS49975_17510 [Clostridia bacterium]|nr:hypothetical protein AGMMS49975_17510 [Clostridia bacterium]
MSKTDTPYTFTVSYPSALIVTSTCNGMSQWGTVPLAEAGYTPLQIRSEGRG